MEWQFILALVLAIPLVIFPAVFIWYLNASGTLTVIRELQRRRALRKKRAKEMQLTGEPVMGKVLGK